MTNDHITSEEAEAVISLWNEQQMPLDASPRLADVAEALEIAPDQAQELLERVRSRREQQGRWGSNPLARHNHSQPSVSPAIGVPAVALLGFASFVWAGWCWQELVSFPLPALPAAGLIVSNVGLWALLVKWGRSVHNDIRRRSQSIPNLYVSRREERKS